jgi:outer membrane protein OmpA-like peptidoglycan-associated protein
MIRRSRGLERALVGSWVAVTVAACATHTGTVVLLPEADGRHAAVSVRQGDATLVLDRPYASASLTSDGPQAGVSSAAEVERQFGAALAAQPPRPRTQVLYFLEQTEVLTEDSRRTLDGVLAEIAHHPFPDIVVVGHTDLVGDDTVNDALARRRAETVRAALVARGIAGANIAVIGRGKREPAVPTADGVAEPRNRRVEIVVR